MMTTLQTLAEMWLWGMVFVGLGAFVWALVREHKPGGAVLERARRRGPAEIVWTKPKREGI